MSSPPLAPAHHKRKRFDTSSSSSSSSTPSSSSPPPPLHSTSMLHRNPLNHRPFSAAYHAILQSRASLPVTAQRQEFLTMLRAHQIVILVGETGSGKTTQIPQYCLLDAIELSSRGLIACTQPRRVAAMSVAQRVANELDVTLGEEVGYSIRFENLTSTSTRLKYCTDGMLLREAMTDPLLSNYSVVILDEAHERTVSTDLLMGLLKSVLRKRPELKLVVMSATLEASKFAAYFSQHDHDDPSPHVEAPLMRVPGRLHPVEIFYTEEAEPDYVEAAIRTVVQIHQYEAEGDILLFLTGEQEIEEACKSIQEQVDSLGHSVGPLLLVPLYSSLTPKAQQRIFLPAPVARSPGAPAGRKVVVSTNIAETSLTIDGIVYVVDPGFSKQNVYDPRTRVESLLVTPISRASAQQRAGRAGRTRPGKAFRLYTEHSFKELLIEQTHPEIMRTNITAVVLQLLKLGITDVVHFDYMDPPSPETMMRALEQLHALHALSQDGALTDIGKKLAEFPIDPQLCAALLASDRYACTQEMLSVVAMLSVPSPFLRPNPEKVLADQAHSAFMHADGDHLTLLNLYDAWQEQRAQDLPNSSKWCWNHFVNERSLKAAESVRQQLASLCQKQGVPLHPALDPSNLRLVSNSVRKALLSGFFMQVAKAERGGQYSTLGQDQQTVMLHPSSCIRDAKPEWVLYHEVVLTSKNFIRTATSIKGEWLADLHNSYFADIASWPNSSCKSELHRLMQRKSRDKTDRAMDGTNLKKAKPLREE